jgi:hypothetical protein
LPNGKNLAQFFAGILKFEFLPRPGDAHGGHLRANLVGRRIFILKRLIQRGNLGARGRSEASTTLSTGTTRSATGWPSLKFAIASGWTALPRSISSIPWRTASKTASATE